MRIALDGLHLFGKYAGVAGSLAGLVTALRKHTPGDELILFVPRDFSGLDDGGGAGDITKNDPGLIVRKCWFPGRWRGIRSLWRNFRLLPHAYKLKCDVLHGPSYALPAMCSLPAVVTIHDTIAFSHPQFCTPGSAKVQQTVIPSSVRAARRVIVPTNAVKDEVLKRVRNAKPDRIDVIPWGVTPDFKPVPEAAKAALREATQLPEKYVLFVGNLEPKKNIALLIQAFYAAKMHRKLPHKLVICGQKGWGKLGLEKLIRDLQAEEFVLFTGYQEQRLMPAIYGLADLVVLPSVIEGFGIPVLEAMACGVPLIVSSAPALTEVCGDAALTFALQEEKAAQPLREAIEEILFNHPEQGRELAGRGLARAAQFTWEKTAELTRQSYQKALE